MAAITIEYQMGCGGHAIGRLLTERLGFAYVDREIVQGVARELRIEEQAAELHDERVAGVLERALTLLQVPGQLGWLPPSGDNQFTPIDDHIYHCTTCQVIEVAARRDQVVIVGHGASFALAGWTGVMHIGLYAPLEQRVQTVMQRLQIDHAQAQRRVTDSDHNRARYIKRFYQANWHDAEHYHLMIDTAIFSPEQVVELITQAWRASSLGASRDTGEHMGQAGPDTSCAPPVSP